MQLATCTLGSFQETGRSQWLWRGLPRRFAAPRGGAAAAERPPAARARWGSGRRPRGFPRAGQCQATDLACSGKIAGLARAASRSPAPAELGFLRRPGPTRPWPGVYRRGRPTTALVFRSGGKIEYATKLAGSNLARPIPQVLSLADSRYVLRLGRQGQPSGLCCSLVYARAGGGRSSAAAAAPR